MQRDYPLSKVRNFGIIDLIDGGQKWRGVATASLFLFSVLVDESF
jgi:hypothetical protein